ncbi:DUF1205 domain-containing protein [Crossiella sp. SN42]|uniref:nucleotide disphospho-sugar-binding domain-containing protein n=1 Tax=Crossiella sp. SN42 TaxID=2944808 RepID=UPI00207C2250|nr:nucleotide disphospho-sugar-binding domain-containing protein [Crossiella sp. SN42]MCO1580334.1 DUF1205 domain-containing protein [Crossiella sp. SN42]
MRVLFTTWAQTGHFQPLAPLGWALRAAGHEVLVATTPGFAGTVAEAGLTAVALGPDLDVTAELRRRFGALPAEALAPSTFERPASWTAAAPPVSGRTRDLAQNQFGREMLRVVLDGCAAMLDDALALTRTWRPDLVVFEPTGFLGPLLAAALDIPSARQLWAPDFSLPLQGIADRIMGPLLRRVGRTEINLTGTLTLDPCPPRLQVPADIPRRHQRYVPYHGRIAPRPWLYRRGARPRICVTWGTTIHGVGLHETYLAPRAVRALSTVDAEVVVAALESQRPLFGELPDNVTHFGPVPLRDLLPGCAAVVHQAGGGTTMSAVVSGVPQLLVPTLQDTLCNATQLAGTGAGIRLRAGEADAERMRTATKELLADQDYRAAAWELRTEALALPTPAELVPVLEALARNGSPAAELVAAGAPEREPHTVLQEQQHRAGDRSAKAGHVAEQ